MTNNSENCIHDQVARTEQLALQVKKNNNCCKSKVTKAVVETVHGIKEKFEIEQSCCDRQGFTKKDKDLYTLVEKVIRWHYDRNLINGSTDKDQVLKLSQELGELSDSVCKGKDIKDDIGDMLVVMINIAERNGVILSECLNKAWEDIKDRKGKMVDGVFVKESDL